MKPIATCLILAVALFSCSEDYLSSNEFQQPITNEAERLIEYEEELIAQINAIDSLVVSESLEMKYKHDGSKSRKACLSDCYKAYKKCYDEAVRFRDLDLAACTTSSCRIQAHEYFLEAYEKCMIDRARCERKCPRPDPGDDDGGGGQY